MGSVALFIGDGTGVGKGEISSNLLDNWLQGRRQSSGSAKADFCDARRDFGISSDPQLIQPQSLFRQSGPSRSAMASFTTYATLRQSGKESTNALASASSRRRASTRSFRGCEWFDGVIVFDESHAGGNAIAMKGERGTAGESAGAGHGRAASAFRPLALSTCRRPVPPKSPTSPMPSGWVSGVERPRRSRPYQPEPRDFRGGDRRTRHEGLGRPLVCSLCTPTSPIPAASTNCRPNRYITTASPAW